MNTTRNRPDEVTSHILYCYARNSTFIRRDVEGLSKHFVVHINELLQGSKWLLPFALLKQFVWLILRQAWRRDIICHFSGYHAVLPSILGRRCWIILAGSDCAAIPAIRYGNHAHQLLAGATSFAVRHATHLLPVHASLIARNQSYADIVPSNQGIRAFVPGLKTPWTEVPYGFETDDWTPDQGTDRGSTRFLCVAGPAEPGNRVHFLKGVDLLLSIAERLPMARFTVVGLADPAAYPAPPANVCFIGRLDASALRDQYRSSTFYLQLSLSEGMPNALCEAMLCGCIPIVSNVSSMPDIIGPHGFVLDRRDADLGAEVCSHAMALDPEDQARFASGARQRIVDLFPMGRRLQLLTSLLENADLSSGDQQPSDIMQ